MKSIETWHGIALVALAACIPVGEGLAFICLGLLAVALVVRAKEIDRTALWQPGVLRSMLTGLTIWLVAGLVAVALSGHWLKPSELGRWAPLLSIPLIVLSARSLPPVWLQRAAGAFLIALSMAALLGVCQYVFNLHVGESLTRVDLSIASQARVPDDATRAAAGGFYLHRLKMAHVVLLGIGAAGTHIIFAQLDRRMRAAAIGLLLLFSLALFFTFARAAVVAGALAALACVALASWRWRLAVVVALVCGGAVAARVAPVRHRMASAASQEASAVRAFLWSQGVRVIADAPLGIGLGNYSQLIGNYYDIVDPSFVTRTYPHNVVLATWAETGPVGLFAYAWAWFALLGACINCLRQQASPAVMAAAGTGLFCVIAFWCVGMTHDPFYHNAVALAYAAVAGWVIAMLETETL